MNVSLSDREQRQGLCYLCFQTLLFPLLLQKLNGLLPVPLRSGAVNFLFFCVNFAATILIFRSFLKLELLEAWKKRKRCLLTAAVTSGIYAVTTAGLNLLLLHFFPDFSNVNDESIAKMLEESFSLMCIGTVFLVPLTEECLFRGALFRGLYDKNPLLAYVMSTAAFCAIHILGYADTCDATTLLLCFIQYIPAGLCLAGAYRISGSICAPVLVHTAVNLVAILTLR